MWEKLSDILFEIKAWRSRFRHKNQFAKLILDVTDFLSIIAVVAIIVIVLVIGIKSYFETSPNHTLAMEMQQDHIEGTDLYRIEDSNLYYDQNTRVVYYVIFAQDSVYSRSFGLMSEYYSENMKKCRYIDGQVQEAE